MGAHGTIANSITYQSHPGVKYARKKPIPTYPRTLAQVYHQWDYLDYAYLWRKQTEAVKQTYRTRASRYHITGFNLWMREHLNTLPDLVARYHFDEKSGIYTYDSSKNANHGTITGATHVPGIIDHALSFDGVGDHVTLPHLSITTEAFTTLCFWKRQGNSGGSGGSDYHMIIFSLNGFGNDLYLSKAGTTLLARARTTAGYFTKSIPVPNPNSLHQIGSIFAQNTIYAVLDGVISAGLAAPGTLWIDLGLSMLGWASAGYFHSNGLIDEVLIKNRALDATEVKIHSERRYP